MKRGVAAAGVHLASSLFALAAVASSANAAGPVTKQSCIAADTEAQTARRAGKFVEARAALAVCTDPSCPAIVRSDCSERMDDLAAAQPTVVLEAKDASGADLTDVAVYLDGRKVADALTGQALPLDPGSHELRCEHPGAAPVTLRLVLREGESRRHQAVVFGVSVVSSPAGTSAALTVAAGADETGHGRRTAALAIGAGGMAVIAVGAIFGGLAVSKWSAAKDACSDTSCPGGASRQEALSERSHAITYGDLSTAGLIAGGVLVAGALTLYLTAPRSSASSPSDAAAPEVSLSPSIGGGSLRVTF